MGREAGASQSLDSRQAGNTSLSSEQQALAMLWEQFKSGGDQTLRDKLILHYAPLVKYVAGRVSTGLPQNIEQEDLISYGIFGLIDAIGKFEPGRGYKFETYAINRIRGAIIDELRSIDWVPRSVRSKAREVEKTMSMLENRLKRSPSDDEVASAMSLSVSELHTIYSQISFVSLAALDEVMSVNSDGSGQLSLVESLEDVHAEDPVEAFATKEMKHILSGVIDKLPEREKIVVSLYYYEGLTLSQIGDVLGVTESRICQMHTKAVLQLRSKLAEATGGG